MIGQRSAGHDGERRGQQRERGRGRRGRDRRARQARAGPDGGAPAGRAVRRARRRARDGTAARPVDGRARSDGRALLPHGRAAPRRGRRGVRARPARRRRALPTGRRASGAAGGAHHPGRAPAAHHARHPPPARVRPRRAGRGARDVRPAAQAAADVPREARRGQGLVVSAGDVRLVVVALVLVLLAGALAASEAALARVSRARAGELRDQGRRGADALTRVAEDPAPTLSVSTFLRVLAESGAAVLLAVVYLDLLGSGWRAVLAAIATMTALSFVAVGVGPRTLGRQHSDRIGLIAAPVLVALTRVLGPLARLLVLVGNLLTPGPGYRDGPFASEAELRELVDIAEQSELIEAEEREMIHSVFELGDTLVREVMVPRTALVSTEAGEPLRSAMSLFLRSGFSRVPVVGEGLDDVRGVLYLKDVARRLHEDPAGDQKLRVDELMRPAHFVPDSKAADDLLREMQRDAGHVAIVVDEYGGTAGMITLEDLVEEIVGEIADEYDRDEQDVEELPDGAYRVRSRVHCEEVGELFGIELEDEEVDTVGGLLAKALGRVPIAGASARVDGIVLTADRFEGRRNQLATVIVRRAEEEPELEQAQPSRAAAS